LPVMIGFAMKRTSDLVIGLIGMITNVFLSREINDSWSSLAASEKKDK